MHTMRSVFVDNTPQLGKNIRFLRNCKGWSVEYFCELFDMERSMLEKLENGTCFEIYLDSYLKLQRFFCVDSDYLSEGDMEADYRNKLHRF